MRNYTFAVAIAIVSSMSIACSSNGSFQSAGPGAAGPVQHLGHKAGRAIIDKHEYKIGGHPIRLMAEADGSVWITLDRPDDAAEILHMSPSGIMLSRTPVVSRTDHYLGNIAQSINGSIWFDEPMVSRIARIDANLKLTEYSLPHANSDDFDITPGPDGRMWFTEYDYIGAIGAGGRITEYPLPNADSTTASVGVISGPDGNVWFTQQGPGTSNFIDSVTSLGVITQYPITSGASPFYITSGPDGALWFTEPNQITNGRITTDGTISEFPTTTVQVINLASGLDGNLWACTIWSSQMVAGISSTTTSGQITTYPPPPNISDQPVWVSAVPGKRVLWLAEWMGKVVKIAY
jgi:virginiamycin B lyase